MRIELRDESWHSTIGGVTQHAVEWIYVGEEAQPRGPVFMTNIFFQRAPQVGACWFITHRRCRRACLANAGQVVLH